jgi:hypothetical protein
MESGILVLQVHSLEDNAKTHRFRLRQHDSMKKLIEKYAEMENVTPEGIQLIFKGNPINKNDTPIKLHISTDDILEVCKVPGYHQPKKTESIIKDEIEEISTSTSPEPKLDHVTPPVLSNVSHVTPFLNFMNNNRQLHSNSPSPAKRSRTESNSEENQTPHVTSGGDKNKLEGGLNLDMLNYPLSHFNEIKSKILAKTPHPHPPPTAAATAPTAATAASSSPPTGRCFNPAGGGGTAPTGLLLSAPAAAAATVAARPASPKQQLNNKQPPTLLNNKQATLLNTASDMANNHITVKRITELEFELGHTKLKNKDLTQLVQMLNAKFILAQRALEEKELIIKQKDKSIEQLNLELERRERILVAYSVAASTASKAPRVSPPSAGSSSGSSSASIQPGLGENSIPTSIPASIQLPGRPGPSWKL